MQAQVDEELYCVAPFMRFSLGAAYDALYFPLKRTTVMHSKTDIALLNLCSQFRTLSHHSSRISQELAISCDAERLIRFVREGALLSYRELAHRLEEAPPDPPIHVKWLASPTRNRPEQFAQVQSTAPAFSP
jgi:hypothetical protein